MICDVCGCRQHALYPVVTATGGVLYLCIECKDKPR